VDVTLASVRFYDPGILGLAGFFWKKFWVPDFIRRNTVNFVTIPEAGPLSFMSLLYILLICFAAGGVVYLSIRRRTVNRVMLLKATLAAFIVCGFIYTLRMDYNWLVIWGDEAAAFSGKGVGERIREINYSDNKGAYFLFNFIDFVKGTHPLERP